MCSLLLATQRTARHRDGCARLRRGPIGDHDFIAGTAANSGRFGKMVHQFGVNLPNTPRVMIEFQSCLQPVSLPAELARGGGISYYLSKERLNTSSQ